MKPMRIQANVGMENRFTYNYTPSFLARSAFFYLQSMGYFCCNPDYYTKREGYISYLLIYTLDGKGYASYRDREYQLSKGQVLLMDCFDYQEYRTDAKELWEFKWIHFNGSSSREYYKIIYENHGPVIDMGDNKSIQEYIDQIYQLLCGDDRQFEIKVSCIVVQMLTDILLTTPGSKSGMLDDNSRSNMEGVIELIDKYYDSNVSLDDMASAANLSKYHFLRSFKKATGYSPYEYLVKFRINKAKSMLESTSDTVEQIALKVGFDSTSNFIGTFKRLEQITPLRYRKYWKG
jgi:AraC-like DNA-binding protein